MTEIDVVAIAERRRAARQARTAFNCARESHALSRQLLCNGDIASAARATLLAERQVKLAERLTDLKRSLELIDDKEFDLRELAKAHHNILSRREAEIAAREAAALPAAESYAHMDPGRPETQMVFRHVFDAWLRGVQSLRERHLAKRAAAENAGVKAG